MPLARVLLLLAFFITTPAYAAINAEGAAKLKTIFENFIAYQKSVSAMPGAARMEYDGEILVEEAGDYYAVTLPHTRFVYPDGSRLDFGMVSINASPHDKPGQWKMAFALPTPIVVMDAAGNPVTKISLGAQKAAGVWDEQLENFAKLDAQYNDIKAESLQNNFTLTIPETQVRYDFEKDEQGKWSGPGLFAARRLQIGSTNTGSADIEELKCDFTLDRYNPAALIKYRDQLKALMDEMAKADPAQKQQFSTKLSSLISDLVLNSGNGFRAQYSASGITLKNAGTAPGEIKIGKGFLGIDLSGFATDKVTFGLKLGYDGFAQTPVPAGYEGVTPSGVNFDVRFENLPARQLAEVSQNTLQAAALQPEMAQLAGISLITKLPAILSQAGATMAITNNHIGNEAYSFDVNGIVKADINAVGNMSADIKGTFRGLDPLLEKVKALAAKPGAAQADKMQSLAGTLEMLKAQGKPDKNANGEPVYTYSFIMTPQGQMLVNGKPLGGSEEAPAHTPAVPPSPEPPAGKPH
ncbi:MAG: hypothetical protein IT558_03885 [Alphaproteobacteria bacterium]|nr:hypothetical protein [Alphaproteobacteria bacterium]